MKSSLLTLLAFGIAAGSTCLHAQSAELLDVSAASVDTVSGSRTVIRETTLADLGYSNGLQFGHLTGQASLYFPVPYAQPVAGGIVHLTLSHGASNDVERHLQISVANRVVRTMALSTDGGNLQLEIPVGADDVRRGNLIVGLEYSGVYSDRVCVDERVSGDFLMVAPDSRLALVLDPSKIESPAMMAALMPADVRIRFADDTTANLAFAIGAGAAFGAEAGHLGYGVGQELRNGDVWRTAQIDVVRLGSSSASEMTVVMDGIAPTLRIAGSDPQVGLSQLKSMWAGLANDPTVLTGISRPTSLSGNSIPLADLRVDMSARPVSFETSFELPFAASDIPAGKRLGSVDLIVASALDPRGAGASVTAFLNGSILGSLPLTSGIPERMTFGIPKGLVGRSNALRVLVQRQAVGGECTDKVQAYPAQILPGSAFGLLDDTSEPGDFFRLTQSFSDGVSLVVDPAIDTSQKNLLEWVTGLTASILPDDVVVVPAMSIEGSTQPFIFVSPTPPAGSNPRVTLDDGAIEIRDAAGDVIFDGASLGDVGIVQIVTVGDVNGIWLRPGSGPAPVASERAPIVLDRGDLAFVDETGIALATSTRRQSLIAITYPDQTSISQVLANYRPWVIGGIWVILTLLTLGFFQRFHRARQSSSVEK